MKTLEVLAMQFKPHWQDWFEILGWLLALAAFIYLANVKGC
jgi:hypothetical protein